MSQGKLVHKSSRKGVVWFQVWIDLGAPGVAVGFSLSPLCFFLAHSVPLSKIFPMRRWWGQVTDHSRLTLLGKPRGKRSLLPYFSRFNIGKSQRRFLMGPAWIPVCTSWTSHYKQEDRVLFTGCILQGYWILRVLAPPKSLGMCGKNNFPQ